MSDANEIATLKYRINALENLVIALLKLSHDEDPHELLRHLIQDQTHPSHGGRALALGSASLRRRRNLLAAAGIPMFAQD